MNQNAIGNFRDLFERALENLPCKFTSVSKDFAISADDHIELVDHANARRTQSLAMRLKDRDRKFTDKVIQALARIRDGSFGICQECEGEIEQRRLMARPTATLCVCCQEALEALELQHDTRRPIVHRRVRLVGCPA